jgi:hypothetical protein
MRSPCSLCLCVPMRLCIRVFAYPPYQLLSAGNLVMYITTRKPISTAFFMNPSHQSVCLYVHLPIVATQWLDENVPVATNTQAIRERVVFYAVRVLSKETRRLVLHRTSCNTIPPTYVYFKWHFLMDFPL